MKADAFKVGASEMLELFPRLLYFVQTVVVPTNRFVKECRSFGALGRNHVVYRMAKTGKHDRRAIPRALRQVTSEHATLKQAAHGVDVGIPKDHFQYHVPDQVLKYGALLAFSYTSGDIAS